MDFNETIVDLNNGSTTSYVTWTGFLNMLNFFFFAYIIRIMNKPCFCFKNFISLIKVRKLYFL